MFFEKTLSFLDGRCYNQNAEKPSGYSFLVVNRLTIVRRFSIFFDKTLSILDGQCYTQSAEKPSGYSLCG
jgi:hypothetical protein